MPEEVLITLKPVVQEQREIIEKARYNLPEEKNHPRRRRFVNFQSRRGQGIATLMPPVRVDGALAESYASAGRYPVFENGAPAEYESSLGAVMEALDMDVADIAARGALTESSAVALREELARFRELAKVANSAQYRAQSLALFAEDSEGAALQLSHIALTASPQGVERALAAETPEEVQDAAQEIKERADANEKAALAKSEEEQEKKSRRERERDGITQERSPRTTVPAQPKKELTPAQKAALQRRRQDSQARREAERRLFGEELTAKQRRQILAAKADYWSDLALTQAEESKQAAIEAARASKELRNSLERLRGMVSDAAMTAEALPDNRDDQAQQLVADAQETYKDAYQAVNAVYRGSGGVNVALDDAFFVSEKAKQAAAFAESVQERVKALPGESLSAAQLRQACQWEHGRNRQPIFSRAEDLRQAVPEWYSEDAREQRKREGVELRTNLAELEIPAPPAAPPLPSDPQGELRPYQKEILANMNRNPADESMLVAAPTGGGKTEMLGHYIKKLRAEGKADRVVIMAHRDELINDLAGRIEKIAGYRPGIVQGPKKEWGRDILVVSHGTVAANPNAIIPESARRADLLIIDEAHHAGAEGYKNIIDAFDARGLLGVTATPYRADKKPLVGPDGVFDNLICTLDTGDLIDQGYLAAPTIVDVQLTDAEGTERKVSQGNNLPDIYEAAVKKAMSSGRRKILVFVSPATADDRLPTEIARQTKLAIEDAGLPADTILGSTSPVRRKAMVDKFNSREEGVLVNFGALNEGFNSPGVDTIILGRDVRSTGTLAQIIGRGMRRPTDAKKDVLVLNFSEFPADVVSDIVYNQTKSREGQEGCGFTTGKNIPRSIALRDKRAAATAAEEERERKALKRMQRQQRRARPEQEPAGSERLPEVVMVRG